MQNKNNTYKHLFGPVVSRRYGLSLGVDLALPKSCSFNCVFCQIGETAHTTITPQNKPPIAEIMRELKTWIAGGGDADIITLAGSGEPTLHSYFGEVLSFIKEETPYPSLLLSNGSLFFRENVRRQAVAADIVKISLHSWDQQSFEKVTRANAELLFNSIIDGYRKFRDIYSGRIDLEVFVVPGINDTAQQMSKVAEIARSFSPDSIFLNSAVRPPAEASVKEAPAEVLEELKLLFGEAAARALGKPSANTMPYSDESLVQLTARHPASINQLAKQFGIPPDDLSKHLERLKCEGVVTLLPKGENTFVLSAAQEHT